MEDKTSVEEPRAIVRASVGLSVMLVGLLYVAGWLCGIGYAQQQEWPAVAVPFGNWRVLAIHLLCAVPLAGWLSARVWGRLAGGRALAVLCVALGLTLAPASWLVADLFATQALMYAQTDPLTPYLIRLGWAEVLVLPWMLAATWWIRDAMRYRELVWLDGILVCALLTLPCLMVQRQLERRPLVMLDAVSNEQFIRALEIGRELLYLGCPAVNDQPVSAWVARLEQSVAELRQQAAVSWDESTGDEGRIARARLLFRLSEFDEAALLLRPLAGKLPLAEIQLGWGEEVQQRWAAAAEHYAAALELLRPVAATGSDDQRRWFRLALERRANNLRRSGAYRQAEVELRAGLDTPLGQRDAYLMQLGYHYQMAGRVREAREFFLQAAAENPQLAARADAEINAMRDLAEGCLLRAAPQVTR